MLSLPAAFPIFRAGLGASLVFCLALGILISWPLFAVERTVPDDARAFLFWMERWNDPGLFPDDRIADYFQSMSPRLFTLLYRGAFELGLDPIEANRLLPLVLTAITTVFIYRPPVRPCPNQSERRHVGKEWVSKCRYR